MDDNGWTGRYEPAAGLIGVEFAAGDMDVGAWIDVGEQVTQVIISLVDETVGNTVSGCYGLTTARADRLIVGQQLHETKVGSPVKGAAPSDPGFVGREGEWLVESTGLISRLTRGDRTLSVAYEPLFDKKTRVLSDISTSYNVFGYTKGQVNYDDWKPRVQTFYGIASTNDCGITALDQVEPDPPR